MKYETVTEEQLKVFGFRRRYTDDREAYWYEKKFSHHILQNVIIAWDDGVLMLWCQDMNASPGTTVTVYEEKANKKNLFKILAFLGGN